MGNKETVIIHGQEYTIAGSSSGDRIREVARYVDSMMDEIGESLSNMSVSSLAILTAVNITDDYFNLKDQSEKQENEIANLQKDVTHFEEMWEEAKSGLKQYREDTKNNGEKLQEMQRIFNEKNVELVKTSEDLEFAEEQIRELENELDALKNKLHELEARNEAAEKKDSSDAVEAEKRYKELENSFFDIQMENIRLKNELDNLRKNQNQN